MGGSGPDRFARRRGARRGHPKNDHGRILGRRLDEHGSAVLGCAAADDRRAGNQRHYRALFDDVNRQRNRAEFDFFVDLKLLSNTEN